MTMHLLPSFFTTTRVRKQKSKVSKTQASHNAWVAKMTKGKTADKKLLDKFSLVEYTDNMRVDRSNYVSAGMSGSASSAKPEAKVYSGEMKLLGIATMHKSNMVPVFAKQDAEDIAKMRR
jgi:hypothetical protein